LFAAALFVNAGAVWGAPPRRGKPAPRKSRPAPANPTAPIVSNAARAQGLLDQVVDQLWEYSDVYWHAGRYEDRIGLDYLIIELDPRFVEPYETASTLLFSNERTEEAVQLMQRGVRTNPDRWEAWHELGNFLYDRKRYPEAVAALEKAVARPGCWTKVYHQLAHAYEKSGELKKSLATWEGIKKREPGDPVVDRNLARVRALAEKKP